MTENPILEKVVVHLDIARAAEHLDLSTPINLAHRLTHLRRIRANLTVEIDRLQAELNRKTAKKAI